MEIHKNTNQQLNELLEEARHDKPVMKIKEVDNIISDGKYTPSSLNRSFNFGINNLIVLGGIVISSFLAYMTLKVDKQSEMSAPIVNNETPAAALPSTGINEINTLPANTVKKEESKSSVANENKFVRPAVNTSTLTASNDNKLAIEEENSPVENMVEPSSMKMPSGEYVITFNYTGQDVKMRLIGDDISEFSVDGHLIPDEQYSDYEDMIAEGKNYLIGNSRQEEGSTSLNLIRFFDGQLRSDIIIDSRTRYLFELNHTQLLVDGETQSDALFKKYKDLYQTKTGKTITEGSVYKFEKGARSE